MGQARLAWADRRESDRLRGRRKPYARGEVLVVPEYTREQSDVDRALYEEAEATACEKRVGLCHEPDPVPL